MKLNKPTNNALNGDNVSYVEGNAEVPFNTTSYYDLVRVLATMLDEIAGGKDEYMIIGATSKRDAFTVTIKENGVPTNFYGDSLDDLAVKLSAIL